MITNLDQAGEAEIVVGASAFDHEGNLLWAGDKDAGDPHDRLWGSVPVAADVHPNRGTEISAGRTLYAASGDVLWHRRDLPRDGTTAVGNFDDDSSAEIVLVGEGDVVLLEHTGETIWWTGIGTKGPGGPPTVGDFDSDGAPEVGVAGRSRYVVFETNGSVKWSVSNDDGSSGATGSSLFDFNADGRVEVLYADERTFRIFDGTTGRTLTSVQNSSVTKVEYPVVADIDGSVGAEIIVGSNPNPHSDEVDGLRVFEAANGQWAPTRSIWNQHSYHIDNIKDDGAIPKSKEPSWKGHNTFRLNRFVNGDVLRQPDLSASRLELIDRGAGKPASLRVRIGSAGAATTQSEGEVTFFDGSPERGNVLGTVRVPKLAPGEWRDVELDGIAVDELSGEDLYARVSTDGGRPECRSDNNEAQTPPVAESLLGSVAVSTDAASYQPGTTPRITGTATNEGRFAGAFSIALRIEDQSGAVVTDLGRTDLGELASGASGRASSQWNTDGIVAGGYEAVATLYASDGSEIDAARTPITLRAVEQGEALGRVETTLERAVYPPDSEIRLRQLVRNVTPNAVLENARVVTVLSDPDGAEQARSERSLGDVASGGTRQFRVAELLSSAATGEWTVATQLVASDNTVLDETEATFDVEARPSARLEGTVATDEDEVDLGRSLTCTDTIENPLDRAANDVAVRRLVLNRTSSEAAAVVRERIDVGAGASRVSSHGFSSAGFEPGDFACALQVRSGDDWRTLDTAEFKVTEPPIDIDTTVVRGERGRLLVLIDPSDSKGDGHQGDDPLGPKGTPGAKAQREWLTQRLDEAGWSYTVVTSGKDFARELGSGEYAVVALLHERVKLAEKVQRELVGRVEENGIGLFSAGIHDRRNGRVEAALGLKSKGKLPHADGLRLFDSKVATADELDFAVSDSKPIWLDLEGARSLGEYTTTKPNATRGKGKGGKPDKGNGAGKGKGKGNGSGKGGGGGPPNKTTALSYFKPGQGRSIGAGFDLLMQGTAAGDANRYSELLIDALAQLQPDPLVPRTGFGWPVRVKLENLGIPTPGRVVPVVPDPVTVVDAGKGVVTDAGDVVWPFELAADGEAEATFWVRLPGEPGPVTFTAIVETGTAPQGNVHERLRYTVDVLASP